MLVDWVTAKLPLLWFDAAALSRLQRLGDRLRRCRARRRGSLAMAASLGTSSTATSSHHALRSQIARARGVFEARLIIEARNDTPDIAAMRQALAALEGATAALQRVDAQQDRSGGRPKPPSPSQAPAAP